jgi:hypothetical protein
MKRREHLVVIASTSGIGVGGSIDSVKTALLVATVDLEHFCEDRSWTHGPSTTPTNGSPPGHLCLLNESRLHSKTV